MDGLLRKLESRVSVLKQRCEQLSHINTELKQSQAIWLRERSTLLNQHKMAISHIENMLSRLKILEENLT